MTDEQRIREQFEKWIDEKQYGLGWQDGRGTWGEFLSAAWAGYQAGSRSRDAEVQALREALESVHYRATRWEVLPTVEAHQSVLRDIGEDARAALVGGEKGTDDE